MTDELIESIKSLIDTSEFHKRYVLDNFLNILFWKDYSEGYISSELKKEIFRLTETVKVEGGDESYIVWDTEKGMEIANKIREKIGLPKLINKGGTIMEKK